MRTVLGACDFASVGPRRHKDWAQDVTAVMARSVEDPRSWRGHDLWPAAARPGGAGPSYPFVPYEAGELRQYLYPLRPEPAAWRLISLLDAGFDATRIPDIEGRRYELLGEARCVLGRFGPHADFYTNFDDFFEEADSNPMRPQGSFECIGELDLDCGLVAVSDDEVGVFWSFAEL
ncbi:hypothetical protein [Streptomyces indicus]|uniref:Uncharacterized protein n=1 Tax=Streptomyces indicus TaxID=417292 RepID=A0A1G9EEM2_9ACTN|nr:hypothetical protein [Streptomyces indicus]SDK74511.1 hypothetical protein SAMN05421806_111116 [Streptomyces indicus]